MSLHFLPLLVMQPSLAPSELSLRPSLCRKLGCHSPSAEPGLFAARSHPMGAGGSITRGWGTLLVLLENKGWVCISLPTRQILSSVFSHWLLQKAGQVELFVQQQDNCPNKINLPVIPARAGPKLHHMAVVSSSGASRPRCQL